MSYQQSTPKGKNTIDFFILSRMLDIDENYVQPFLEPLIKERRLEETINFRMKQYLARPSLSRLTV